jgi:type I restriction enzyme M protein
MLGGIPVSEIKQFAHYWQAFPDLRKALFTNKSSHYAQIAITASEVKHSITQHSEVKSFAESYSNAFSDFDTYLTTELIKQWQTLNIAQHESILSHALFTRLEKTAFNDIALIDKYQAYQLLNNHWQTITADLEMLQTEGFAASKRVEPNMVNKKAKGKDTEVQDGWSGHILPFDLVQASYLNDELQALKQQENRLAEITAEFESILDSLSEEEKEAETVKENKDGFANANVVKEAKHLKAEQKKTGAFDVESYPAKIIQVDALITEEKALKKSVKADAEALHLKTKATIESLNDEQVNRLLELKWISPLLDELSQLPSKLIHQLTDQVQKLADKYATTYADVANDIKNTEQALAGLIDELTGNEFDRQGLAELNAFLQGE